MNRFSSARSFGLDRVSVSVGVVALLVACGQGSLSLQEYGAESEALVIEVTQRIDTLDSELESSAKTSEGAQAYWTSRLDAREDFVEGLESLDPPDEAVELHERVVHLFRRLNSAEQALADRVTTIEPETEPERWWETTEGLIARDVDAEVASICHIAQAKFDKTEARTIFEDTSWLPPEMKQVVRVAFQCPE